MTQKNKVGVFIRELRISKGFSQTELGNKLHVTKKAVSRWETGRGLPDSSMLLPLSEALGVSTDEILKGEFTIPEDVGELEQRKLKEINTFLKYCREKRNVINSLIVTFISTISFLLSAHNDAHSNLDFGYMGVGTMGFHFIKLANIDDFSLLTNILLLLLIVIFAFTVHRVIIFLKTRAIFEKG